VAFFGTTIEVIKTSVKHPNADKLSICTLEGIAFTFVTGIDQFKTGQKVIYFPIDSIIPDNLAKDLGVFGKLAGNRKNRLKTCKIRGVLSQGLVGNITLIDDGCFYAHWKLEKGLEAPTPEMITQFLGVTKYEPPVIPDKAGNLKQLPCDLGVYDIEGCERFHVPLEKLMDQKVWVLEKVEGSNGSVSCDHATGDIFVNQRRHTIEEIDGHEHAWWNIARKQGFIDFVKTIGSLYGEVATLYFEVAGPAIQGNIYKLTEPTGFVFDLKIGSKFVSKGVMFSLLNQYFGAGKYMHAPILSRDKTLREWLGGKTIAKASNFQSHLYPTKAEGIVISPEIEQDDDTLGGRLILKQRSPEYLAESDN